VKQFGAANAPIDDRALGASVATRELFGANYERVAKFAQLLQEHGELRGLLGPSEAERIWDRHILNSAALLGQLPDLGAVADLGSGAGLPGVVLAIGRPDLSFTLIEPMERRAAWLNEVRRDLYLDNVEVVNLRGEQVRDTQFDVVTARAVASVSKLATWAIPLLKPGGRLLALKGRNVGEELVKARKTLSRLGVNEPIVEKVRVVPNASETTVLTLQRQAD